MSAANVKGERRAIQRTMEALLAGAPRRENQSRLPGMDASGQLCPPSRSRAPVLPERIAELVFDLPAERRLADLVLPSELVEEVNELIHEFCNAELLHSHSLEPRHTLLLVGPPGNGKTSLAEAIAAELSLPLLAVRYDAIVDSYLGETSSRLRKLVDFASATPCVLFFDEFEAVGKERSDNQETGEIKRVVSSLLLQMDRLPSHSLVVCATNHPELLDRAIWRRFELQLRVDYPTREQLRVWFERFEQTLSLSNTELTLPLFLDVMKGRSMSDVEAFTKDVRRKLVLSQGKLNAAEAVQKALARLRKRPIQAGGGEDGHQQQLPDRPAPSRSRKKRAQDQRSETNPAASAAVPAAGPAASEQDRPPGPDAPGP